MEEIFPSVEKLFDLANEKRKRSSTSSAPNNLFLEMSSSSEDEGSVYKPTSPDPPPVAPTQKPVSLLEIEVDGGAFSLPIVSSYLG